MLFRSVRENPKIIEEWIERGILIQCNYASVIGKYGKEVQKTVELLLRHNLVHFLGTDSHRPKITYPYVEEAKSRIIKLVGEKYFKELSEENAEKVLKSDKIYFPELIPIKRNIFGKYK